MKKIYVVKALPLFLFTLQPLGAGEVRERDNKEQLCSLLTRVSEELFLRVLLYNMPIIEEDNEIRYLFGKSHLMGNDDHGHPCEHLSNIYKKIYNCVPLLMNMEISTRV